MLQNTSKTLGFKKIMIYKWGGGGGGGGGGVNQACGLERLVTDTHSRLSQVSTIVVWLGGGGVPLFWIFRVAISVSPHVCFILVLFFLFLCLQDIALMS